MIALLLAASMAIDCERQSLLAETVMQKRQDGMTAPAMASKINRIKDSKERQLLSIYMDAAYKLPLELHLLSKQKAVAEFASSVFMVCKSVEPL
jgi:hypothetical protein